VKKREKIIVSATVIVVIYGAYSYMMQSPGTPQKPRSVPAGTIVERLNGFVKSAAGVLKESTDGSVATAYIISRAENEWVSDPFYTKKKEAEKSEKKAEREIIEDEVPIIDFRYTGYLEVGTKRMAIINGNDYEVGGKLEPGGFVIKGIYPTRIVIVDRKGRKITVPFTEEWQQDKT